MSIVSRLPLGIVFHATAVEMLCTVFACYGLAVGLGHVPHAWLPMISACGVCPPETYVFRLGFSVGSVGMWAIAVLVYFANKAYSRSKVSLVFGSVASLAIGVVGVVNEHENLKVHDTAAIVLFSSHGVYMTMQTILSWKEKRSPMWCLLVRALLVVVYFAAFITYIVLGLYLGSHSYGSSPTSDPELASVLCCTHVNCTSSQDHDLDMPRVLNSLSHSSVVKPFCEWCSVIIIILYNWIYAIDFKQFYIAECFSDGQCESENGSGCSDHEMIVSVVADPDPKQCYLDEHFDNDKTTDSVFGTEKK